MKVLLVNKFHYLKGGAERYYFALADGFKALGHEVIFFSMQDEKNLPCDQSKYFVSKKSTDGSLKQKLNMALHIAYSKEAYKKMTQLLKDENPDLVILNNIHKQITCSIIDAIKDYNPSLKIFWTVHDLITICPAYTMLDGKGNICEKCLDGNFKHCAQNKCCHGSRIMSYLATYEANYIRKKKWYDKVDLFICPSEFYRKKLIEANFTKSKIICMRNPLPIDTTYEINDSDKGYLLYFGRLSYEKGILTLIKAMKDIDYKLEIVGDGPIRRELEKYVSENNMKNVIFEGPKYGEELKDFIRGARAVVLPSEWYENGPYSAMEAMALGKPLIVSNKGGLPELVKNMSDGTIFSNYSELILSLRYYPNLTHNEYAHFCLEAVNKAKIYFNCNEYINKVVLMAKVERETYE